MDANDTTCKMVNIYLYSRYERFWHWLQSALIVILLVTGFETNGMLTLFGFKTAVEIHTFVGISWLIAFAFFVFWVFTTGDWNAWGLGWLPLGFVAAVHLAGGFAILSFLIVHIYMITTGHSLTAHTRAMICGWEEVEDRDAIGDWEIKSRIKTTA